MVFYIVRLVIDHRGDVNSACVPRGEHGAGTGETEGFPVYGWVLVTLLCLLLLMLFGGIVWYVLKHPDTLKILACKYHYVTVRFLNVMINDWVKWTGYNSVV